MGEPWGARSGEAGRAGRDVKTGAKVRQSDCALKRPPDFFSFRNQSDIKLFTPSLFTVPSKVVIMSFVIKVIKLFGVQNQGKIVIYFIYYYFEPKKVRFSLMTLMTNDIMTHAVLSFPDLKSAASLMLCRAAI